MYFGIKILLFQLIPYGFYPPVDILPGDFRTDGFFKGHTVGGKAVYSAEPGIQQGFGIAGFSGYQPDRDMLCLCPPHHPFGKLAHECLTVGMSFAGNDEVGMCQEGVEFAEVEQEVGTRLGGGLEVLQEGVSQSAGSSGTGLEGCVSAHASGRFLGKLTGASVQFFHHRGSGSFLWGENLGGSFGSVERIAYIAGQYEVAVGQRTVQYVFYRAAGSQGLREALKHAFSGIARTASA